MDKNVLTAIDSEVEYAKSLWERLPRSERPLKDEDKPVEFWIMHMRRYLRQAEEGCYGTDKREALEAIRKLAALAVRCMENQGAPHRIIKR
jgi:hypothetical protein